MGFAMAAVDPQFSCAVSSGKTRRKTCRYPGSDELAARRTAAPDRRGLSAGRGGHAAAAADGRLDDFPAHPGVRRAYAVAVRPTAQFLAYHSFHLGWLVLLAGLSISGASALILGFTVHRREDLAHLAQQQARKLAESAHHFHLLAQQNRIVTWETNVDGLYVDVGDTAEAVLDTARKS
jgi:PAS domain-containing protein